MTDGMDIWSSEEGGKCAEVRDHVGIFEFLDGGHGESMVVAKGYGEMGTIAQGWASLEQAREGGNA